MLDKVGIEGPLWFNDPGWSKPSLTLLAMWGVGTILVIFLAAILDVPKHLHESAELDGAGAFRRLRYVTLPTISPVILFAVVLGVIQALQYFTQAYVAASIAAGQASQAGTVEHARAGLSGGLDALLPDPPLLPRLPVLQHGLRLGDGHAAARCRVRGDVDHRPQLAALGALLGSSSVSDAAVSAPFERRKAPRAGASPARS